MLNWEFLLIALSLTILAFWFISKNYRRFYKNYKIDWSDKLFFLKVLLILFKTCISLFVIILIHNLYHNEKYLLMMVFVVAFIAASILQSEYARVGFQARIKYINIYIQRTFLKSKKEVQRLFKGFENDEFDRYLLIVKILLLLVLFFIFLSQISILIITNLFLLIVIYSLILLTFILNNLIYFGFTSFIVLQYSSELIKFNNFNFYIISIAFIITFIGMIFDSIFNQRICIITGSYYIKSIHFDEKFNLVYRTGKIQIFQNRINRMYYLHYRTVGYVLAFESYYDAKIYKSIQKKMIHLGKIYLIKNKSNLKKWL